MTDAFRRACLIAAVICGCAFSAFQIIHDVRVPVQLLPGVAARVNGRSIDRDSINRTVAGMDARERRSESATRQDVLSRMIDEELLVQHALDSGAAETSPEVRAALVHSAITRVNAEAAAEPISERELSDYFDAHHQVYATSARFDVTPFYFESKDLSAAQSRAAAARAAMSAGTATERVLSTSNTLPFASPSKGVTARTLANYFGPETADLLDRLSPGETTEAKQLGDGVVFIYVDRKTPGEVPSLASIHDLVAADAMRDRQERALEGLLGSLHQAARIEFATAPPATVSPPTASRAIASR
jgi:parvulin-like peptidyl-prolyl isomerase